MEPRGLRPGTGEVPDLSRMQAIEEPCADSVTKTCQFSLNAFYFHKFHMGIEFGKVNLKFM